MALKFQAVLPKPFDADVFEEEMAASMLETGNTILRDFQRTWETWEHKPEPDVAFDANARLMQVHVFVDAQKSQPPAYSRGNWAAPNHPVPAPINLVYYMLNVGTSVRFATMTPGFRPKSRRGVIGSRAGAGAVASVSVRKPKPGIVAREWDVAIAAKTRKGLRRHLRNALRRAIRRSGHGYS